MSDTLRELNIVLESLVANLKRINQTTRTRSFPKLVPARDYEKTRRRNDLRQRGDINHGTVWGYKGYKCRCDACTKAKTDYERAYRARALKKGRLTHGTISGYNIGCRCDQCATARRVHDAARPPRKR